MNNNDYDTLKNLVSGIKGTENTLNHIRCKEEDQIKEYAINALEDFIDTCEKLKIIVVDSGLLDKIHTQSNVCFFEKDKQGIIHHRSSTQWNDSFEFDIIYGPYYGSISYYKNKGDHLEVDDCESAKNKIEFIKTHSFNHDGCILLKQKADMVKLRTKCNIQDIKNALENILNDNRNKVSKLAEFSGIIYEKVGW